MAEPKVLAARLASFLWNESAPSQDLLDKAAAVTSPSGMMTLATQMLADARARAGIAAFFQSWLRLGDFATLAKPAGVMVPELVKSMQEEAPALGTAVIFDGDARYETLMLAPYTYMDETLARHYGINGVNGSEMRQVPYESAERVGILMGAGVLARFSGGLQPPWPPRRFWLTEESLLCEEVPAGMANSARVAGLTIRQDLEMRTADPTCVTCHSTVNPVGLSFSRFDTFGRYAPNGEDGQPLQTAGSIPAGLGVSVAMNVTGASDMIQQMIKLPEARRCFASRWLAYALNPGPRAVDALLPANLQCSLDQASAAFESSHGDIRALIVAVAGTSAFMSDVPQ